MPESVEYSIYQGLRGLPHFSPEIDGDNSPESVVEFRKLLKESNGVLICTPEYAFGVPGVLKNALDWTVSTGDFYEKPVFAISASPLPSGGDKAHASLMLTLTAMQSIVINEAKILIPAIYKKLGGDEITDPATKQLLGDSVNAFAEFIKNHDPVWKS